MRVTRKITLTPGTPINLAVALGVVRASGQAAYVNRVFAQMATGGSGLGYIMSVPAGLTPAITNDGHVVAELQAGTANAPGGTYEDQDSRQGAGIDLTTLWIDGAAADPVRLSADLNV